MVDDINLGVEMSQGQIILVSKCVSLTHNSLKCLEWNSAYEKLKGFFPLKYAILRFEKCLNN